MPRKSRKEEGQEARNLPHGEGRPSRTKQDSTSGKWVVVVLGLAKKEGRRILTDLQYDHIVEILKRLVDFGNSEETADLDIKPIQSFYELREKWGPLGRINLRVYFSTIPAERELVIAKAYKKEDDGPTPRHVIIVVEDRLEEYKAGGLRKSATVYQETASKE